MKKLAALIAIAMCSSTVFAKTGPYVGMRLGYSNTKFNLSATATARTAIETRVHHKNFQGTASGVQGQLIAGYAYDINNKFNLATELTAQFPKTNYSKTTNEDTPHYKFYNAYGINLVPSYFVTRHSSIYLKIGVTRGKFGSQDFVSSEPHTAWNTSFYATGFNLGLGSAIYLSKNLRISLEYLYTDYQTHKFHHAILNNMPAPSPIHYIYLDVDGKIHPKIHTFMLGFDYQFDSS